MKQLVTVRAALRPHRCRDVDGYAEILAAKALGGTRSASGITQGHDLVAPVLNRVEVRHRMRPANGRCETRIRLKPTNRGEFDWLAGVIFTSNFEIQAGFLLPHDAAWDLAGRSRFSRFTLNQALSHPAAQDITSQLRAAEIMLDA